MLHGKYDYAVSISFGHQSDYLPMLTLFVILGAAAFLALLPLSAVTFIAVMKFNQYLSLQYPALGTINAWQSDKFLALDMQSHAKAKK